MTTAAASRPRAVLGVDGCKTGWVGIVLDANGHFADALSAPDIEALVALANHWSLGAIGIDIPIGLPDRGARESDALARKQIGRLASSVFTTPTRSALEAADYATAAAAQRDAGGPGLTHQAFGLRRKILEVDRWLRSTTDRPRVVEAHPEVCFASLNGGPLRASKRTWDGMTSRRALLTGVGVVLPEKLGEAGEAAIDDVLDAAVVAWTAHQSARNRAKCLPDPPERFGDGLDAAIWCPA
jgi:predicted RNase H-like nuclease